MAMKQLHVVGWLLPPEVTWPKSWDQTHIVIRRVFHEQCQPLASLAVVQQIVPKQQPHRRLVGPLEGSRGEVNVTTVSLVNYHGDCSPIYTWDNSQKWYVVANHCSY